MAKAVLTVLLLGLLPSCSLMHPCLPYGAGTPERNHCMAAASSKADALAFARALELGDGVAKDEKSAAAWYRRAATPTPSSTAIYVPAVGGAKYGTVMNVNTGPGAPGSPEAMYRLGLMYRDGRGDQSQPGQSPHMAGTGSGGRTCRCPRPLGTALRSG